MYDKALALEILRRLRDEALRETSADNLIESEPVATTIREKAETLTDVPTT